MQRQKKVCLSLDLAERFQLLLDGHVVWTIRTPPEDPIPISLSFKMEAPVEEKDLPMVMMMAGDEIVGTAVEKALGQQYQEVLKDTEIRDYFAASFDRYFKCDLLVPRNVLII